MAPLLQIQCGKMGCEIRIGVTIILPIDLILCICRAALAMQMVRFMMSNKQKKDYLKQLSTKY